MKFTRDQLIYTMPIKDIQFLIMANLYRGHSISVSRRMIVMQYKIQPKLVMQAYKESAEIREYVMKNKRKNSWG